jgi:hypothetical protein
MVNLKPAEDFSDRDWDCQLWQFVRLLEEKHWDLIRQDNVIHLRPHVPAIFARYEGRRF